MTNPPRQPPPDPFNLHGDDDAKARCDLDTIFKAGAEARLLGHGLHDNPYAVGSAERAEWDAGFKASPQIDPDEDPNSPL